MNSMQVKCVIALGKTKNYTKAAENLYVSQSTVSKNISRLEKELGFKIVEVQDRKVQFTKQGQYFYTHISKIHRDFDEVLANIYAFEDQRPIIIRHSMVPFERFYLPRFLNLFKDKSNREIQLAGFRPNISYEDNVEMFYENQADFILMQHDFFHDDDRLGFLPLMKGQYSVIINRSHPLAQKTYLNIADLANEKIWIWNSNPGVTSVIEIEKRLKKVMPSDNIHEANGLISCEMYATANMGVGIVPSFAYDNRINPQVVYNFLEIDLPLTYGAFYLKSAEKEPFFKPLTQALKKAVEEEKSNWI